VSRNSAGLPQPRLSAEGTLVVGAPQLGGAGESRIPVYLAASRDLVDLALTFALGDMQSQLHFVPAQAAAALVQDSSLGVVAAVWQGGIGVAAGQRLLLGYVDGPASALPNVRIFGASASTRGDNRALRLEVSPTAGREAR